METTKKLYIIANFGGPRNPSEIAPFLQELLTDPEVIRTSLPSFLQKLLFSFIAKKRAKTVSKEYQKMGGKSPLFADTEKIGLLLEELLKEKVLCFHRYLPATHAAFFEAVKTRNPEEIIVFPMFAQFSYTTTGSIAKLFYRKISPKEKVKWVFSYALHEGFIKNFVQNIQEAMERVGFLEEKTLLLFSCHGLPEEYVMQGDPYQKQCEESQQKILSFFPKAIGKIAYQSQFGKKKWIEPYTQEVCENITNYSQGRDNVLIIPLSFTSDHLETLVEIEDMYLPLIQKNGLKAFRCPALNTEKRWVHAIVQILQESPLYETKRLLRKSSLEKTACLPG